MNPERDLSEEERYLCDREGPPDPEIARFEALLRGLAWEDDGARIISGHIVRPAPRPVRMWLVAAVLINAVVATL